MSLAIENHGDLTVADILQIIDRVGRSNLGVTLDNLNLVHSSEEGAWCGYCRQVTVFVRDPGA